MDEGKMSDDSRTRDPVHTVTFDAIKGQVNVIIRATESHDVADVQAFEKIVTKLTSQGDPRPWFVDVREDNVGPTAAARAYYIERLVHDYSSGVAILTGKAFQRMIGSFVIMFDRPSVPFRIFTDEQEAQTWLGSEPQCGRPMPSPEDDMPDVQDDQPKLKSIG
jgi:hypothetical protein